MSFWKRPVIITTSILIYVCADVFKLLNLKTKLFEVQGLLLLIKMDVVELVPSVSFRPRTNVNGWMSDRTSKVRR